MFRVPAAILLLSVCLCGAASGSRPEEKLMRWYAPDSSWGMGGFRVLARMLTALVESRDERG